MAKPFVFLVAAVACVLVAHAGAAASTKMTVPRYAKFEVSFSVAGMTGNPYDPAVNDVEATFVNAKHAPVTVPAFWDGSTWRVRFAALDVGRYQLSLTYNGAKISPADLSASAFTCEPSDHPGFIHRDPVNLQRFLFSNGSPYYPFGMDYAWQAGKVDYPQGLAQFHDAGLNWARIWMNNWDGKNLEWGPYAGANPPIGSYYQPAAQRWDMIMDNAAKDGVYVQMTLQHHGEYTAQVDPNWAQNPFNVANGGWLQHPDDFFTDPKAIALTKAKYRYIEARYGYSTHLFAYELFNEVQNIVEARTHFQDVINWHNTMAAYIRSIDPYHHLITTSVTAPSDALAAADIDFYQIHTYPNDLVSTLNNLPIEDSPKPIFVAECGAADAHATAAFLHNGLWAGIMTPTAGGAEYWSWDDVQANNSFALFKSISSFLTTTGADRLGGGSKLAATATGNGPKGSMTLEPALGWQATTGYDVTISHTGAVSGLGNVSSFLQGKGHPDMQHGPIDFHIDATSAGKFVVHFVQISRGGAHPTLTLDGSSSTDTDLPAGDADHGANGATVSIDFPAGSHVVALGNTGPDWVTYVVELTNFASPVGVMAHGTARNAAFWAYPRQGYGTPMPPDSKVMLSGLRPGKYKVQLWDCVLGKPLATVSVSATAQHLSVALPATGSDVAGYITHEK